MQHYDVGRHATSYVMFAAFALSPSIHLLGEREKFILVALSSLLQQILSLVQ